MDREPGRDGRRDRVGDTVDAGIVPKAAATAGYTTKSSSLW